MEEIMHQLIDSLSHYLFMPTNQLFESICLPNNE